MAATGGGLEIIFPVKSIFEMESAKQAIGDMQNALSQQMTSIKLDIPSSIGKSLTEQLGGGQGFFNSVQEAVGSVGKLRGEYITFGDTAGNITKILTSETKEYRDQQGNLIRDVVNLKTAEEARAEALAKGFSIEQGRVTAESNWQKASQQTEAQINKEIKAVDANALAAEKYLAKSKNMRGQQVESARAAAEAVIAEGNALKQTSPKADDFANKVQKARDANEKFRIALEGTKAGANVFQSFITRMGNAIQQTIAYATSIQLVYKAQQLLNSAIRYAIDLNTEMVKIQVLQAEGAQTPEQINALAESFNELGQAMGASTLEIAKGSVEWFRQGRTVKETAKLMESSLMLAKLGAMSSADATNYLTSITNAFKVSTEDAVKVVDKLIAVDNIAATSAGELATAMRYTSESAALAGVSMDQLVSYIGVVSTVTRQNAEMIGQAFKTMFARMTQVQGGGLDETGMSISKVEQSLAKVNITLRNSDDTWRNMGDVLEEIAAKWGNLDRIEKGEIATAVAGVRQREPFFVLMENMNKALEYQVAETEANGLAWDRYGIYLDSVEAKQGQLTAAMQELYSTMINSDAIKFFLDASIAVVNFLSSIGGIPPLLLEIIAIMVLFKKETIAKALIGMTDSVKNFIVEIANWISGLVGATAAEEALSISQSGAIVTTTAQTFANKGLTASAEEAATAVGSLAAVINILALAMVAGMFVYQAIKKHADAIKKAHEEAAKAVEDFISAIQDIPSVEDSLSTSIDRAIVLQEKQRKGMGLTTDEAKELNSILREIYKTLPTLNWEFLNGQPIIDATTIATENLRNELIKLAFVKELGGDINAFETSLEDTNKQYAEYGASAEEAAQKTEFLAEAQAHLEAGDLDSWLQSTIQSMQGFAEGGDFLETIGPQWKIDVIKALKDATNPTEMSQILSKNMVQAWMEATSAETSMTGARASWAQLISAVIGQSDEESLNIMTFIYDQIRQGNQVVIDAYSDVIATMEQAQIEARNASIALVRSQGDMTMSAEEASAAFDSQVNAIDTVLEAWDNFNKVASDTDSTLGDTTDAAIAFVKAINDAQITDQTISLEQFKDAAGKIDVRAIQQFSVELVKNKDLMDKLAVSNRGLWKTLTNYANDATAAIWGYGTVLINATGQIGGQITNMTAAQFAQFANMVSQTMWEQAQASGVTLQAVDGQVIQSAEQIEEALAADSSNYANFVGQLTSITNQYLGSTLSFFQQAANFAKGLTAYTPVAPSIPTGGGGKEEDPRIKALEEEIDKKNETIYQEERIIKKYEDEKKAIDRLIDAQKEIEDGIQRQIDGYQEQIDDLDRQIQLYEREKELIDRQIDALEASKKPYEDQLDNLDKQVDAFNEMVDAEKERLQTQKDEADFLDEITKKHKDLGKIDAQIAMLSLDNSEEAQKKRMELEEQASGMREDIAKTTADKEYDMQIKGLEDAQKAYENMINGQKKAIEEGPLAAIQEQIDALNNQKDAYDALIQPIEDQQYGLEQLIYPLEEQIEDIDLIIQGYDDQKAAIDKLIQPHQDIIDKLQDEIEVLNHEKDQIQKLIDAVSGGGGGGGYSLNEAFEDVDMTVGEVITSIKELFGELLDDLGITDENMQTWIAHWAEKLGSVRAAYLEILGNLEKIRQLEHQLPGNTPGNIVNAPVLNPETGEIVGNKKGHWENGKWISGTSEIAVHSGGLIESHHTEGGFAGSLTSNEVFAKLLKGEYVATEAQMKNFMKNILPKISAQSEPKYPLLQREEYAGGPITFDVDIIVQGSLDKTVIPKLKDAMLKDVIGAIEKRGIRRTAIKFTT